MFVRFRVKGKRLAVDLIDTRREGGNVRSEHIARLGSLPLPEPFPPHERVRFWRALKERWRDLIDRLGNRVSADDRKKALHAIDARIPKPDKLEERLARARPIKRQAEFWEKERKERSDKLETAIAELRDKHALFVNLADLALAEAQGRYVGVMQGKPIDDATIADGDMTILQVLAAPVAK